MALHFTAEQFADRRRRVCNAMVERGLDGLLMFRQESMYYLTGYDTFGYVFFQCLYLGADGKLTLLTRSPDLRQAQHTSIIEDIRIWRDAPDANPSLELMRILEEHGCKGHKLGVEFEAYGLTARNGKRLEGALDNFVVLADASNLVTKEQLVKSPAELVYVRKAAELADAAWGEAQRVAVPGAFEGDILAAMHSVIFRGGGDDPANEFVIGSGRDALLCRYYSGRRNLDASDQLTLEFAGTFRHYHSCLMRTLRIGAAPRAQVEMHQVARDALLACEEALRPGKPIGDVFEAHRKVLDEAGYGKHRLNACGYSMGATFAPNWMDSPMFYKGNPLVAAPGMVFFIHIIIANSDDGLAMTLGRTSEVTENGVAVFEPGLSRVRSEMSTVLQSSATASSVGTAHRVAASLRQRLLSGQWRAGMPLREASLAIEFGVSRNTLREAFGQLAVEGLVTQQLYKGVVVRTISVDQVRDIFLCRRVVELGAIAESATASEVLFADVAATVEAGEAAAARGQWQEAGTASLQFHQAVVALLGSPHMNEFFLILATQLRLAFSDVQNQAAFQAPWLPRDRQIGNLLLSGRRGDAAEAMSRYLSDSEKFLLDTLRSTRHQKRV